MRKPAEFLVLTGAVSEPGHGMPWNNPGLASTPDEARKKAVSDEAQFYGELVKIRDDVPWATLDMRALWEDYLAHSPRPRPRYQRDFVHANARGKQVLGQILAQFFQSQNTLK